MLCDVAAEWCEPNPGELAFESGEARFCACWFWPKLPSNASWVGLNDSASADPCAPAPESAPIPPLALRYIIIKSPSNPASSPLSLAPECECEDEYESEDELACSNC